MVDHREMVLQAVKQRYLAKKFYGVGATVAMSHSELCGVLGVREVVSVVVDSAAELKMDCAANDLIMSPCRASKHRCGTRQRYTHH